MTMQELQDLVERKMIKVMNTRQWKERVEGFMTFKGFIVLWG